MKTLNQLHSLAICFLIAFLTSCAEEEAPVKVSSVSLNTATIEMVEGETFYLSATVLPNNAVYDKVTWESSDASVASVNQGIVTALKQGTSTIIASAGGMSATCTVKVDAKVIAVTSVTLDNSALSIYVGNSKQLKAAITPENATDKNVTWETSDPNVATVDTSGNVLATACGQAIITAKCGYCSASCVVTVKGDEDLNLEKDVWMEMTGTSYKIISIDVNGNSNSKFYYGRTYTIHNDSPVNISLIKIGTSNFQTIGVSLHSGKTRDVTLYFENPVFPKITLKFSYNKKDHEVYLENYEKL